MTFTHPENMPNCCGSWTGGHVRRLFGFVCVAVSFLAAFVATPLSEARADETAMDQQLVEHFVQSLADKALTTLQLETISADERRSQFRIILEDGFHLETISLLALGKYRRTASADEIEEYQTYFYEFILAKYSELLGTYSGETFVTTGSRRHKRDVLVDAKIVGTSGPPIKTEWRVRNFDGDMQVIDIKVEGVSMVLSQREEFYSILAQGGMPALIGRLKQWSYQPNDQVPA